MLDVDHLHHFALNPVADQIGANDNQFAHLAKDGAASIGISRQVLNRGHKAGRETLRRKRRKLSDIGVDSAQIAQRSR